MELKSGHSRDNLKTGDLDIPLDNNNEQNNK